MQYSKFESPMGTLYLTGRNGSLTGLSFDAPDVTEAEPGDFTLAKRWLADYFQGKVREIDVPLQPRGTPFQHIVWNLLLKIPYGETRTYGELASEAAKILGKEIMSAQAVGQAVGKNPIAVIIPCHRVVGAGGKLTGYAYGLERKKWLLEHEQNE